MACRSFNSPIARNRFYISARVIDHNLLFSSLLFAPLSSSKQSWIGTLESSPTRSVIYGFGSCSHRGGVMTGRSAPGYHLYRFPIAPSPLSALRRHFRFLAIPRDDGHSWIRRSLTGFWVLNWWTTPMMNSLAVVLGASEFDRRTEILCQRLDMYIHITGNHLKEFICSQDI